MLSPNLCVIGRARPLPGVALRLDRQRPPARLAAVRQGTLASDCEPRAASRAEQPFRALRVARAVAGHREPLQASRALLAASLLGRHAPRLAPPITAWQAPPGPPCPQRPRASATMTPPRATEAGSAGKQPGRGIARRTRRNESPGRGPSARSTRGQGHREHCNQSNPQRSEPAKIPEPTYWISRACRAGRLELRLLPTSPVKLLQCSKWSWVRIKRCQY